MPVSSAFVIPDGQPQGVSQAPAAQASPHLESLGEADGSEGGAGAEAGQPWASRPALQCLLRDRGHEVTVDGVSVDGVSGPRTMAVVLGFQRALGIVADGIVGPATWRALVSGMLALTTGRHLAAPLGWAAGAPSERHPCDG